MIYDYPDYTMCHHRLLHWNRCQIFRSWSETSFYNPQSVWTRGGLWTIFTHKLTWIL